MKLAQKTVEELVVAHGALPGPYRIVVIEARSRLGDVVRRLLESMGHQVETASDGRSGVELVKSIEPAAVFCCIELPYLDGFGVAREIRNSFPNKPFLIAHTGYGKWQIGKQAKEAGFDILLTKPASIADLWRALSLIESANDCEDLRL